MEHTAMLNVQAQGDREIVMTRLFNAPPSLVFDAWTKPELLMRWFGGPEGWSLSVCEVDLRVGGRYRFVTRHVEGEEMGWGGVYREIVFPERLVSTEVFDESWYAGEALVTMVFSPQDGKTALTMTVLYESRDARDTALASGMEEGFAENLRRLDAFLASPVEQS